MERITNPIWFNEMKYMQQDLRFIKVLLKANIYSTGIPNLFEKLELFKKLISSIDKKLNFFLKEVEKFKNSLHDISEEDNSNIEDYYFTINNQFKKIHQDFQHDFQESKYQIFNYLEAALIKKRN